MLGDQVKGWYSVDERSVGVHRGEDIGAFNGAFKVTQGLLEEFGAKRVRDTPISENTIVGVGDPRTLRTLDLDTILATVRKTNRFETALSLFRDM